VRASGKEGEFEQISQRENSAFLDVTFLEVSQLHDFLNRPVIVFVRVLWPHRSDDTTSNLSQRPKKSSEKLRSIFTWKNDVSLSMEGERKS
jgi:hypothetical protein